AAPPDARDPRVRGARPPGVQLHQRHQAPALHVLRPPARPGRRPGRADRPCRGAWARPPGASPGDAKARAPARAGARASGTASAQLALEDLAGGGHGQLVAELDDPRVLVVRELLLAPGDELVLGDRGLRRPDHERL